jgi:hypothetical protein
VDLINIINQPILSIKLLFYLMLLVNLTVKLDLHIIIHSMSMSILHPISWSISLHHPSIYIAYQPHPNHNTHQIFILSTFLLFLPLTMMFIL